MEQKTRNLMTMHKALNPKDDIHRFYVSRKKLVRGLESNENSKNSGKMTKNCRKEDLDLSVKLKF